MVTKRTTSRAKPKLAPADAPRTIAHHLDQGGTDLAHAKRHTDVAMSTARGSTKANLQHTAHHLEAAKGKMEKATEAVVKRVPAVGAELKKLQAAKPKKSK